MTHYAVLGVAVDADVSVIREAYKKLARRHHPDRHLDDGPAGRRRAEDAMREVNVAWTVLSDPARRAAYDASIGIGASRSGNTGTNFVRSPPTSHFVPHDTGDDPVDPAGVHDRGVPRTETPRWALAVTALCWLAALLLFFLWFLVRDPAFLALGVAGGLVGGVLFVGLPIIAMARAADAERRR